MTPEIAVLVSAGRHPVSGRARRARIDAQALELGLRLAAAHGANLHVLHAGDPDSRVLRDYLGMGVDALHVLALDANADPVPALAEWLHGLQPRLVLTGTRAEAGWSSGCVPYALASALGGYALVPGVVDAVLGAQTAEIRQALPRGRRRALRVTLPAIATVDPAAPPARQSAYARARRGRLVVETPAGPRVPAPEQGLTRPARARPSRLSGAAGATAAERLRSLMGGSAQATRVVRPASAAEAAQCIHALLEQRGLVPAASPASAPAPEREP